MHYAQGLKLTPAKSAVAGNDVKSLANLAVTFSRLSYVHLMSWGSSCKPSLALNSLRQHDIE